VTYTASLYPDTYLFLARPDDRLLDEAKSPRFGYLDRLICFSLQELADPNVLWNLNEHLDPSEEMQMASGIRSLPLPTLQEGEEGTQMRRMLRGGGCDQWGVA
jgi:hypothetical protein